ncbi:MAG: thiazole biosynthesis protein [Candidatus Omnitrophica bacterium]|nr:thiazole biosynthesis protein [Candidatus Omnitrophota bacterium]
MKATFSKTGEADITRAIVRAFAQEFDGVIQSDCIVVGAGPSGLMAARDLARKGRKVLVLESANYLGGGLWLGGYLFNKLTVRAPAQTILKELGVPCRQVQKGLFVANAPHVCSKLIAATCDAGVKFAQMTAAVDVVVREAGRVEGVVVNWSPISALPKALAHVDPIALESKIVIDATGHDADVLKFLAKRGLTSQVPGDGAMWVESGEQAVMDKTGEAYPGVFVTGLAVSATYGTPRMGPAFGSMLLSGRRCADLVEKQLKRKSV